MNATEELLKKVYDTIRFVPAYDSKTDYNLFRTLEISGKEVLMCRFLADLLNPEGDHGCGILFLKTFLEEVLQEKRMSDSLLAHTIITKEYVIDKERRIDLVIRNADFFIPMEVKIYAGEQEGQCFDYFERAKNSKLVYLTRFGNQPSLYSRRQRSENGILPLSQIQCISWSKDVCNWLERRLGNLPRPIEEAVLQYLDAIHSISDGRKRKIMEKTMDVLYESPDYFAAGLEIERSMKQAKLTLLRLLFDDFKEAMEPLTKKYGLELETDAKYYSYENPKHDRFYDCYSTYPGLNYVVKQVKFQKESLQMWFRFEIEQNLFAGFSLFDTEAEPQDGYLKGYQVNDITEKLVNEAAVYLDREIIVPENWWFAWNYSNGKRSYQEHEVPDFKAMNECAVSLVDPERRKCYVREAVAGFEQSLLAKLYLS